VGAFRVRKVLGVLVTLISPAVTLRFRSAMVTPKELG
jgi:hypothetical protein